MSVTQKYSPISSTTSKTNSARTTTSTNTASATQLLPTVRTATSTLQTSAKSATKQVGSTVKDLQSTSRETVKSIEQTVTPMVKTVIDPIVETATNISTSLQGTTKETIRTIENSPITKRFLGLFVVPFQKHGSSIIAMMILIFGVILIFREMNKGKPVEIEKKNMIGKIVYETFNKDSSIEGFSDKKNPQTNCPSLKQGLKHKFCKTYNSDKVSDDCLEKRCKELKDNNNCDNAKCCTDNKLCEAFTPMNINSDFDYYKQ